MQSHSVRRKWHALNRNLWSLKDEERIEKRRHIKSIQTKSDRLTVVSVTGERTTKHEGAWNKKKRKKPKMNSREEESVTNDTQLWFLQKFPQTNSWKEPDNSPGAISLISNNNCLKRIFWCIRVEDLWNCYEQLLVQPQFGRTEFIPDKTDKLTASLIDKLYVFHLTTVIFNFILNNFY